MPRGCNLISSRKSLLNNDLQICILFRPTRRVNPRTSFFLLFLGSPGSCFLAACGDDGARTRNLVVANHALSQLSYTPDAASRIEPLVALHLPMCGYLDSNQGPQLYQSCALAN